VRESDIRHSTTAAFFYCNMYDGFKLPRAPAAAAAAAYACTLACLPFCAFNAPPAAVLFSATRAKRCCTFPAYRSRRPLLVLQRGCAVVVCLCHFSRAGAMPFTLGCVAVVPPRYLPLAIMVAPAFVQRLAVLRHLPAERFLRRGTARADHAAFQGSLGWRAFAETAFLQNIRRRG